MSVVLAAAFAPELAPYGPDGTGNVDLDGTPATAVTVGVGLVAAAIGAALIAQRKPSLVVFSGTCGAYPAGLSVFDVVVADRLCLVLPTVLEGRGRAPEGMSPPFDTSPRLVEALRVAGAIAGRVATTPAITTDDALAARIATETRCVAEHLEAYAVAAACAAFGVPFVAVLGVANPVGARAHAEWRANHEEASLRACEIVRSAARFLRYI